MLPIMGKRQVEKNKMLGFYSVNQFFNADTFDKKFMDSFYSLSEFVQEIVISQNQNLKNYLEEAKEKEYDEIDFSQERINVKKVFLRKYAGDNSICPRDGTILKKKTVAIVINGKTRGIYMNACMKCKRFYSNNPQLLIEKYVEKNIPYEILDFEGENIYEKA